MQLVDGHAIQVESKILNSAFLQREVQIDFYLPAQYNGNPSVTLLLFNDGQLLEEMGFNTIIKTLQENKEAVPFLSVAIHAGKERKLEYGIASQVDYCGRGSRAGLYTSFILKELLPFISNNYSTFKIREKIFAGFSLGGLMALDIVWNYPWEFSKVGVFSGSFWWRSIDQAKPEYNDDKHRIIHQLIRNDKYKPGLKFFFQCGNMDETRDRNKNGIIDSIDDTLDLVKELLKKGYHEPKDIFYMELKEGKHDAKTWSIALPVFLKWVLREDMS